MKKIFLLGIIIAMLTAMLVSAFAFADTMTTEQQICELATQNERVLTAKCLVYERHCIVAIKTEKFATKTDYEQYVDELTNEIKSKFEVDNVIVTRNPKVMHKLTMLEKLDGDKRDKLIKEIIERELNKDNLPLKPIMPRLTMNSLKRTNV